MIGASGSGGRCMGRGIFAAVAAFALILGGCCAPSQCRQAKTGPMVLDPVLEKIEHYKERNGRYPVVLDDVEKGLGEKVAADLRAACPDCRDFRYKTDSFGFMMEYSFEQNGKNACRYSTDVMQWVCRGEY